MSENITFYNQLADYTIHITEVTICTKQLLKEFTEAIEIWNVQWLDNCHVKDSLLPWTAYSVDM